MGSRTIMLKEERQNRILTHLRSDGRVVAGDLSRRLAISDDTIRRDLRDLEEAGLLQRVHGGALPRSTTIPEYTARVGQSTAVKDALADAAIRLLSPGQVVFLDGGTTIRILAERLPVDLPLTVVTHSIPAMAALAEKPNIDLIMLGGRLFRSSQVAVGAETVDALRRIRADICMLGVASVHPEIGLTVFDHDECQVKRAMVECADRLIVLADEDKLNKVAPYIVAPAARAHYLVTEPNVPEAILAPYRALGIQTVCQ